MSLDSIIKTDGAGQSSGSGSGGGGYGKNQRGDRNTRRQSKPYQRQPRQGQQPQQSVQPGSLLQQQQQQLQSLLSMPLSSFPQVLQQLPMLTMQPHLFNGGAAQPFNLGALQLPQQPSAQSGAAPLDFLSLGSAATRGGELRELKVSATSNPKNVAGSISHTSRLGACPTLLATGQASLNQAIKAIAIARGYLEEDRVELSVTPQFRDEERGAVSFALSKSPLRRKAAAAAAAGAGGEEKEVEESTSELRVAQNSEPSMTAGSIAKKIRGGERVSIVSIGAGSVSATVRAITIARRYLEGDSLDVSFRPSFIHLTMQEGQRSAIKFVILAQQV